MAFVVVFMPALLRHGGGRYKSGIHVSPRVTAPDIVVSRVYRRRRSSPLDS
jgi:hypothetical protein